MDAQTLAAVAALVTACFAAVSVLRSAHTKIATQVAGLQVEARLRGKQMDRIEGLLTQLLSRKKG